MKHGILGKSGIAISPLVFGGNVFGWTADEAQSLRLLDAIVDAGITTIDTADVYSAWVPGHTGGESETLIGKWLQQRGGRDKVVIATKVGMAMPGGKGLSKAWIERAVDDSLRRLHTDYIDLYQAHADDPDTPLEETLAAFDGLIKAGKVRAIGASNYGAARFREALATSDRLGLARYVSMQPHYNLVERGDYERELETLMLDEGIGVIPYYSLASGFLSGKYRSSADTANAARGAAAAKYLTPRGLRVLAALDDVAARRQANPTQVALAWLMARPSISAPIASATRLEQVADLAAATQLSLSVEDIGQLDAASDGEG